jgi:hypothetical protein
MQGAYADSARIKTIVTRHWHRDPAWFIVRPQCILEKWRAMRTVIGFIAVLAGAAAMMPLLVEPTPFAILITSL